MAEKVNASQRIGKAEIVQLKRPLITLSVGSEMCLDGIFCVYTDLAQATRRLVMIKFEQIPPLSRVPTEGSLNTMV